MSACSVAPPEPPRPSSLSRRKASSPVNPPPAQSRGGRPRLPTQGRPRQKSRRRTLSRQALAAGWLRRRPPRAAERTTPSGASRRWTYSGAPTRATQPVPTSSSQARSVGCTSRTRRAAWTPWASARAAARRTRRSALLSRRETTEMLRPWPTKSGATTKVASLSRTCACSRWTLIGQPATSSSSLTRQSRRSRIPCTWRARVGALPSRTSPSRTCPCCGLTLRTPWTLQRLTGRISKTTAVGRGPNRSCGSSGASWRGARPRWHRCSASSCGSSLSPR
mmetsp:Transcript_105215/g.339373  ORF Transcript_105215/g.339373 Transcript_105215/m.339373 type:complete len:279 (+) Transcript_105215:1138-1974(+)